MPWSIKKRDGKFCVIKDDNNEVEGCHDSQGKAADQLKALYASEAEMAVKEFCMDGIHRFNEEDHLGIALELLGEAKTHLKMLYEEDEGSTAEDDDYHGDDMDEYRKRMKKYYSGDTEEFAKQDGVEEHPWEGPIVFEGIPTGDNRVFKAGAIQWDEGTLPWAFRWQKASTQGHAGAVPIGRVDQLERRDDGSIYAYGVIIPSLNEEAAEYLRLLESGVASGVSVDGDSAVFDVRELGDGKQQVEFSSMRLRSLTAVDIPAFNKARIEVVDDEDAEEFAKKKRKAKRKSIGNRAYTWGLTASAAIAVRPSIEAFVEPQFDGPTPISVSKDGMVSGHLALFGTCHIGFKGACVTPPKGSDYRYFHTGEIETAEGDIVEVGHLTFNTGHANITDSAKMAAAHYDHTGTVAADVRCGEDEFGIWVVGALRPHLSDEDLRAFRAAPLSGDWRKIAGKLELVGALAVNVPGFPVPRVRAMVASGETETLLVCEDGESDNDDEYDTRLRQDLKNKLADKVKG